GWTGTVRRRRYSPQGVTVTVEVAGTPVLWRMPPGGTDGDHLRLGDEVRIAADPQRVHSLPEEDGR
ncbi:MAG: TOBE domain-containing protein, partial [Thermoplasmata archaeon]